MGFSVLPSFVGVQEAFSTAVSEISQMAQMPDLLEADNSIKKTA